MKFAYIYAILCLIGVILPYSQFIPFFLESPDIGLFISQVFANKASAGLAFDLLVTGAAAILFIYREAKRLQIKNWWLALVAIPTVGFSLGLPLFLYMREKAIGDEKLQGTS